MSLTTSSLSAHIDLTDALAKLAGNEAHSVSLFTHGTLELKLYAPAGRDMQSPHRRDELYVVARGRGVFFDGDARRPCAVGTALFVPAGRPHRFEDFTDDFAVWVMFYGPDGGEGQG